MSPAPWLIEQHSTTARGLNLCLHYFPSYAVIATPALVQAPGGGQKNMDCCPTRTITRQKKRTMMPQHLPPLPTSYCSLESTIMRLPVRDSPAPARAKALLAGAKQPNLIQLTLRVSTETGEHLPGKATHRQM